MSHKDMLHKIHYFELKIKMADIQNGRHGKNWPLLDDDLMFYYHLVIIKVVNPGNTMKAAGVAIPPLALIMNYYRM